MWLGMRRYLRRRLGSGGRIDWVNGIYGSRGSARGQGRNRRAPASGAFHPRTLFFLFLFASADDGVDEVRSGVCERDQGGVCIFNRIRGTGLRS
jgi:hypothetical protein